MLYVGSCSGVYYAFDRATGAVKWSFDTGTTAGGRATFHSNPVVVDDLIITGTDGGSDGYIFALDLQSGEVRWKRLLEQGQVRADLLHVDESVIALAQNGDVVALDPANGEERWSAEGWGTPDRLRGSLAAADGVVFVGGLDQEVYALDAASGEQLWRHDLGVRITTSIIHHDEHLYLGGSGGDFYRFSAASGEVAATLRATDIPGGTPEVLPQGLAFFGEEPSNILIAVDFDLTRVLWTRKTLEGSWSSVRPLLWNGQILVGNSRGTLAALDPSDGSIAWSTPLEGQLRGLGSEGDTLFVGTTGGALYAYRVDATSPRPGPKTSSIDPRASTDWDRRSAATACWPWSRSRLHR